jgi:hypothetical protein
VVFLTGRSDVAGQYLGIAAMLMESYALDTVWAIGAVVSFGIKYLPTTNLFNNCGVQVDVSTSHPNTSSPGVDLVLIVYRSCQIIFSSIECYPDGLGLERLKLGSAR